MSLMHESVKNKQLPCRIRGGVVFDDVGTACTTCTNLPDEGLSPKVKIQSMHLQFVAEYRRPSLIQTEALIIMVAKALAQQLEVAQVKVRLKNKNKNCDVESCRLGETNESCSSVEYKH